MGLFGRFRGQIDEAERARRAAEAERTGLARLQEGNLRQAEAELRKAVSLSPDNSTMHGHLGMALFRQGRLEEANTILRNAINLGPMDDMLRHLHGQILEGLLQIDEASEEYRVASSLNPRSTRNIGALATLELTRNNLEAAEDAIRRTLELDPTEPRALQDLAELRRRGGDVASVSEIPANAELNGSSAPVFRSPIVLPVNSVPIIPPEPPRPPTLHAIPMPPPQTAVPGKPIAAPGPLAAKPTPPVSAPPSAEPPAPEIPPAAVTEPPAPDSPAQFKATSAAPVVPSAAPPRVTAKRSSLIGANDKDEEEETPATAPRTITNPVPAPPAQPVDELARLEAAVAADPNNSRLHRDLSIEYLRAGRIAEAKAHARRADIVRAQRTNT